MMAAKGNCLLWHGLKRRYEIDHMRFARAGSVPGHGAQSAWPGPVECRDGSTIGVSHLNVCFYYYYSRLCKRRKAITH
jgi:hypothetical protein